MTRCNCHCAACKKSAKLPHGMGAPFDLGIVYKQKHTHTKWDFLYFRDNPCSSAELRSSRKTKKDPNINGKCKIR